MVNLNEWLQAFCYGEARHTQDRAAIAFRVYAGDRLLEEHVELIDARSSNVAEYEAILRAMESCAKLGAQKVACHSDSELAVRQLSGEYKVKAHHLIELRNAIRHHESNFIYVTYRFLRRGDPHIVPLDGLVNRALDVALAETEGHVLPPLPPVSNSE